MIARAPAQALAIFGLGIVLAGVHWAQEPVRLSAFGDAEALSTPVPPPMPGTTINTDELPLPLQPVEADPIEAEPIEAEQDSGTEAGGASPESGAPVEGAPPASDTPDGGVGVAAPPSADDGPMIGTATAVSLWGTAVFVDAREPAEYIEGHIAGAVMVPASATSRAVGLADLGLSTPIVVYCGGGECDASELVAISLLNLGFSDVRIYKDGYPAWAAAGHPTETGEDTLLGPG